MSRRENLITMMLVWCLLSFAFVGEVCGQTASRNYIRKAVMTTPYTSNPVIDFENARITVDYYDGLGRPIQSVNVAKAVEAEEAYSLYTIYEYDSYGKPYRTWLPIPNYNLNGDYQDITSLKQEGVDFYNDALPFSETGEIAISRETLVYILPFLLIVDILHTHSNRQAGFRCVSVLVHCLRT